MRILIIEDEQSAARRLERIVKEVISDAHIIACLATVEETLSYWEKADSLPELILMDIHLADGSAFDILDQITINCPIIFTTAYDEYALQAFKHNSIDYLLKPIKKTELQLAVDKLRRLQGNQDRAIDYEKLAQHMLQDQQAESINRFVIKYGGKIKMVELDEIAYFYIESKVTLLKTFSGRSYALDYNLEELDDLLPPQNFFRINRSCIVQVSAIEEMHRLSKSRIKLTLNPPANFEVIASSEKSSEFKKWLPRANKLH